MSAQPGTSDFFKDLTARILAALREGVVPWRRPWRSLTPTRYTGLPFTGTNSLVLSLAADARGYANPFWLTRAQGRRCRAEVLDGEEGTRVMRPLPFSVPDRAKGARHRPPIPLMEPYRVFNGEQFDRLPPRFRVDEESPAPGPGGQDRRRRRLLRGGRSEDRAGGRQGDLQSRRGHHRDADLLRLRRSGQLLCHARARSHPLDRPPQPDGS